MATTIADIAVKISVIFKDASKGIKQVEKDVSSLGGKFKAFQNTSKIVWAAIGASVVAGLHTCAAAASEFETDLTHLGNITQTSGKDLEALGKSAQQLGTQFGVSSNEVVHGLTEMGKLGFSTAKSLQVMPQILKFTATASTDMATSVRIVETALKDFNLGIEQTSKVLDIIQTGMNKSGLEATDFKDALKKAGASGALAKASIADVTAAITILGVKGFKGAEAGTAMNAIFGKLARGAGPAAAALKKIGIASTDASGNMKSFPTIIDELKGKWDTLTDTQKANTATSIAGVQHQAKLLALINGSGASFAAYSKEIEANTGVVDGFFGNLDKTAGQSFKKLSSAVNTLAQNLGKALGPAFAVIADEITSLIDWFNNLDECYQDAITVGGSVVAVLALIAGAVVVLAPLVTALGAAFAFLMSPIGLVILAIAAVTAALIYLYKHNETARKIITAVWNGLKVYFSALVSFYTAIWNAISGAATRAWDAIANKVRSIRDAIKYIFGDMVRDAVNWGSNLVSGFANGISRAIGKVKSAVSSVANTVAKFLRIKSPSEFGPLSTSDKWMPNFMDMMAQGIEMGIPKLQMAVGDVASTLDIGDGISSGNTNNVNIYPRNTSFNAGDLNRELARMSWMNGGIV